MTPTELTKVCTLEQREGSGYLNWKKKRHIYEKGEENTVRSEQTQILSKCAPGFPDKHVVNATLVRTMLFPAQGEQGRSH